MTRYILNTEAPLVFGENISMGEDATIRHQTEQLYKLPDTKNTQANQWFKDLYDHFAPVRAEIIARGMSEEEVNADIDAALQEVRSRQK